MIKRWIIVVFLSSLIVLTSCNTDKTKSEKTLETFNNTEISEVQTTTECTRLHFDSINIPYDNGDNYEIFADEEMLSFHYNVWDNNSNKIDDGYYVHRGGRSFSTQETETESILALDYGYGGSPPSWECRYYDVTNGRVSRFFHRPVAIYDDLVAYFTKNANSGKTVLVIQNMFEPLNYYKEIARNFSSWIYINFCEAQFIENGGQLKITYWINPNDEEVTEIIDLM